MTRFLIVLFCLVALTGCKIVFEDEADTTAIPDGPEGDDARNAARLEVTFDEQLLPLIEARALSVAALRDELGRGLDTAGAAHATQGAGRGAAWNFAVADTGKVVEANLTSSARTAEVDVDGDGAADLRLQLGPVIRGTALRDVAPFYNFDDFRDQIEYAKLARAINDQIKPTLVVPDVLVGETISFVGVVPLKSAGEQMVVTPISVGVME